VTQTPGKKKKRENELQKAVLKLQRQRIKTGEQSLSPMGGLKKANGEVSHLWEDIKSREKELWKSRGDEQLGPCNKKGGVNPLDACGCGVVGRKRKSPGDTGGEKTSQKVEAETTPKGQNML